MNKTFYKFCIFLLKPLVRIFFPYDVKGKENLNKLSGGYIICSNHLSLLDPVFLVLIHPQPIFFMAKSELFRNRLLKKFVTFCGASLIAWK